MRRAGLGGLAEKRAVMAGRRETRGVEHTLSELHPFPTIPSYWRECVCPCTVTERRLHTHTHTALQHTLTRISNSAQQNKKPYQSDPQQTHNTCTYVWPKPRLTLLHKDGPKHKCARDELASLWIALCSALWCVRLALPAHFGTTAKREGEKREDSRGAAET